MKYNASPAKRPIRKLCSEVSVLSQPALKEGPVEVGVAGRKFVLRIRASFSLEKYKAIVKSQEVSQERSCRRAGAFLGAWFSHLLKAQCMLAPGFRELPRYDTVSLFCLN